MVYSISKLVFWPVIAIFVRKIKGIENLPDRPFILVANHESFIDGVLLVMMIAWHKNKQLCYFATNEKFTGIFWDLLFKHYGAIRVNGSLKKGVDALSQGSCMGISPEGERTYTGKMQAIKNTGLGVLALQSKVPVVPVGLSTFNFWNRHHTFPSFKRNIVVTIGKPMTFKGKVTKPQVRKVINKVWKEVRKLARISHS